LAWQLLRVFDQELAVEVGMVVGVFSSSPPPSPLPAETPLNLDVPFFRLGEILQGRILGQMEKQAEYTKANKINKIYVVYHDFPLDMHQFARKATRLALAAERLGRDRWLRVTTHCM
jgi:hypothetical protein